MTEDPFAAHLLTAALILAGAAVLGKLLEWFSAVVLRRIFERTKTTLDDKLLELIRKRLTVLSIIAGAYLAINEVRKGLTAEHVVRHQLLDYIGILLFVVLVLVLTRLVSRIIRATFEWYIEGASDTARTEILPTVAPLTMKIVNMVLFLIGGMILLDHFGINIGSLLVSLGVGSLAVALAAQETVANMIAGFVILIDQPFRVGDRIKLPTGEEGDVHQIGLRSTRILNPDRNLMIIPNGELVKNRIVNFSFPDSTVTVLVEVTVPYGTDTARAREILAGIAAAHPDVQKDPPPRVFVVGAGDAGIQLRLACVTHHFRKKFEIETAVREQLYASFDKAGVGAPIPQRAIQVVNHREPG